MHEYTHTHTHTQPLTLHTPCTVYMIFNTRTKRLFLACAVLMVVICVGFYCCLCVGIERAVEALDREVKAKQSKMLEIRASKLTLSRKLSETAAQIIVTAFADDEPGQKNEGVFSLI